MPITLQELRPDDSDKALAFAQSCRCPPLSGRVVTGLSLLALDGDTIAAAMFCVSAGHRHHLALVHPSEGIDTDLHRLIVDKTLMKLRAAGVRACDMTVNGSADNSAFFSTARWVGEPPAAAA